MPSTLLPYVIVLIGLIHLHMENLQKDIDSLRFIKRNECVEGHRGDKLQRIKSNAIACDTRKYQDCLMYLSWL